MFKTKKHIKNDKGFTLVELMVTVFLTAIAMISIYRGYTSFSQAADAQQQVMEMQQNLRIGMARLSADIRRAGMNEEYESEAGFMRANNEYIEFSMDISNGGVFKDDGVDNNDDGDADDGNPATDDDEALEEDRIGDGDIDDDGERVRYQLVANGTTFDLERAVWQSGAYVTQTIITNVEALDFVYWDAGSPGPPVEIPVELNTFTKEDPAGFFGLEDDDLEAIDRVEITLVVRTTNEDYRYTDRQTYPNLQGTSLVSNVGDNFRRRVFSMSVQIRNNI